MDNAASEFSNYISPFSRRYGSAEMREFFSERTKYQLWRRVWVTLAQAEHEAGLVSAEELADLIKHQDDIDIERIEAIEQDTRHDVVAGIREFAEKAKIGGPKIHLGATSMDVTDNAEAIRTKQALKLVEDRVRAVLVELVKQIDHQAGTACLGYTHLQAAEPTTIGYRLAFYASDLLNDYRQVQFARQNFKAKGMKGAIGTRASYTAILTGTKMTTAELDESVMKSLGVEAAEITTQVVSRKNDYLVLSALAGIGASLAKFAGDLRILQSAGFDEWSEPFGAKQVGSSAMPFKRNPINSEKICSLARLLIQLPVVALENASLSYLERTIDDSANRRLMIPEAFLIVDEILITATKLIKGLRFNSANIQRNLANFAPFAATESIIIEAVKKGADRQLMHETLREIAMKAWESEKEPGATMTRLLNQDKTIGQYLDTTRLEQLLDVSHHLGDAPERARQLAQDIKQELAV